MPYSVFVSSNNMAVHDPVTIDNNAPEQEQIH